MFGRSEGDLRRPEVLLDSSMDVRVGSEEESEETTDRWPIHDGHNPSRVTYEKVKRLYIITERT